LVAQVAEDDHQRTTFLPLKHIAGGTAEVGGLQGFRQVVDAVEQGIELFPTLGWRDKTALLGSEAVQPQRVALAQSDIAQQQARIEGVVEVRKGAGLAAHADRKSVA